MELKKIEFFNKLSFITLLITLFVSLFLFIPYISVSLEISKSFLLSIGTILSFFFWLIGRLGEGKIIIPKDRLILFAFLIPLVFLIASLFSISPKASFFGSGFEIGTLGSMLILSMIFFLSSINFQSEKRLWFFVSALFVSGLILILFELFVVFIGFSHTLPMFLKGVSFGNLVGDWNNFALLLGIFVLLSTITIELLNTKILFKIIQYLLLTLSIIILFVINFQFVWLLVGIFSLIIFIYSISIQRSGINIIGGENNKKRFPYISLIIIFTSFLLLISHTFVGNFVSKYANLNNPNIRPSIVTTFNVAVEAIKHNYFLGTGPNTFVIDWTLWQPENITPTIFWNIDFTNGYSFLSTIAVTTGLVGLLLFVLFFIIYLVRGLQSIKVALKDTISNYFIVTILIISIYSWITIIFYNPNILILMLAFCSSGILVGILAYKQTIHMKVFSFLTNTRYYVFYTAGVVLLMVSLIFLVYVYVQKFTSIVYFYKSLNNENRMESLLESERLILKAISIEDNDTYYRLLSDIYLNQIIFISNNKKTSPDILKSDIQQLITNSENAAKSAIAKNPKYYLNYMNLGNLYKTLAPLSIDGSRDNAIVAYDKAYLLAPHNPSILLAKASLEFTHKNNIEARKFINQALDLKSNYVDAIFLLAQIETNEGNFTEAIKQAERGGEVAPNDPTVFFRIGLLHYDLSNFTSAIYALEKAVMLNDRYWDARFLLGQAYKNSGRISDALVQFNVLNKALPDNQDVKNAINLINELQTENDTLNVEKLP